MNTQAKSPQDVNSILVRKTDELQQQINQQTKEEKQALKEIKDTIHKDLQALIKETTKGDDDLEAEIHKQTVTIMLSIAAIILTFVWQNTLETAIKYYFDVPENALKMKVIFASIVTVIVVAFIFYLNKKTEGAIAKGAKAEKYTNK